MGAPASSSPPSDVRVRPAVPADGPRILELERQLADFEKLSPPDDEEGRRVLAWIFETHELEALVAERDGQIEGIALFYEIFGTFRGRKFLYLEDLVVDKETRGGGIGQALMAALASEALARGARRLEWSVLDWNAGAIRLYERLGAQRINTEWLRYGMEEAEMKEIAGESSL
jgi:ribosomal protein S18 acetylase RimI-like enzyme